MKVHFSIPFSTSFGQEILITGSIPELNGTGSKYYKSMQYIKDEWHFELSLKNPTSFNYSYILKDINGDLIFEAGPPRNFLHGSRGSFRVFDQWRVYNDETPFLSDAFKKVFFNAKRETAPKLGDITLTLSANNLSSETPLLICGDCKELGNWDLRNAPKMNLREDGLWYFSTDKNNLPDGCEYKFAVMTNYSGDCNEFLWESGENRALPHFERDGSKSLINLFSINLPALKPRLSGTAVPVFSLRTNKSSGIGEFTDLKDMVDLLSETSQNVLQILPVNDTTMTHTWVDSYPYGAISIYAMHPLYINLEMTGTIKEREFRERHQKKVKKLNTLETIDYEAVANLKWSYLKKIYTQEGDKLLKSKEFRTFFKENEEWLTPYASFCYLRDKYKSADFRTWPKYSTYNSYDIKELASEESKHFNEIAIHYFVQFHLHKQLSSVHEYANSRQIILKGDIPIGVNKNSVEAWVDTHLFNFDGQAGAPPDDFSVKGQNWGFPTYNWDLMERDGFSWWKKRFTKMAEYFDAYRIDHILGFFRIWEIPVSATEGLMGRFSPALPLTADEIRSFGYEFNYERDTLPFITDTTLYDYFGDIKEVIKKEFLEDSLNGTYRLKKEFNTQLEIENYFTANPESEYIELKQQLLTLCAEVLFLQDKSDHDRFHPRISSQFTKSYESLNSWQKECYNRVYNHFFYERNESFWYHNAMKKLPSLISSTGMLVCGEDLGMIPSCVPAAMDKLRIMSLEIQRMPKDPRERFGDPRKYPYLSVCTTGTHDTSTLRGWWEEDYELSSSYYRDILGYNNQAPFYCEPWLCERVVVEHLNSPSMLTILPLQDWLSIFPDLRKEDPHSERINVPANPKHYWRYRMHLNIEDLIANESFKNTIKQMIEQSGRRLKV
ncbi:MAG: 4-alpha-glucanotransferase [Bacteroidales bacterium]|jgi:4-alpha-glucanotransferase|nr:4-alpha-glucanotransferase [Bacteroidales bacterium]